MAKRKLVSVDPVAAECNRLHAKIMAAQGVPEFKTEKVVIDLTKVTPNVARNLELWPLSEEKVDYFMQDFAALGYWGTIMVRQVGGGQQIVYGHHRAEALRRMGQLKVDGLLGYPVSDAQAARMLITENHSSDDELDTRQLLEGIGQVRDYLEKLIRESPTLRVFHGKCPGLFENQKKWETMKGILAKPDGRGVGQTYVEKFLGNHIKPWRIDEALRMLLAAEASKKGNKETKAKKRKSKTGVAIAKEALVAFSKIGSAQRFRRYLQNAYAWAKKAKDEKAMETFTDPAWQIKTAKLGYTNALAAIDLVFNSLPYRKAEEAAKKAKAKAKAEAKAQENAKAQAKAQAKRKAQTKEEREKEEAEKHFRITMEMLESTAKSVDTTVTCFSSLVAQLKPYNGGLEMAPFMHAQWVLRLEHLATGLRDVVQELGIGGDIKKQQRAELIALPGGKGKE